MNHQNELLERNRRDIQYRFNIAITITFVVALLIYSWIFLNEENESANNVVTQTTEEAMMYYFDSLVTLMLTGQMQAKETIRNKMLARPGVKGARLVRNPELYEDVTANQQPQDDLEEKALNCLIPGFFTVIS